MCIDTEGLLSGFLFSKRLSNLSYNTCLNQFWVYNTFYANLLKDFIKILTFYRKFKMCGKELTNEQ